MFVEVLKSEGLAHNAIAAGTESGLSPVWKTPS